MYDFVPVMSEPGAPIFSRSVNPIATAGGQIPRYYYWPPQYFHLPASLHTTPTMTPLKVPVYLLKCKKMVRQNTSKCSQPFFPQYSPEPLSRIILVREKEKNHRTIRTVLKKMTSFRKVQILTKRIVNSKGVPQRPQRTEAIHYFGVTVSSRGCCFDLGVPLWRAGGSAAVACGGLYQARGATRPTQPSA